MNIAFANTTKEWGGGEKWHLENSIALSQLGETVIVLTNSQSVLQSRAKQAGLNVRAVKTCRLSFLNVFKILKLATYFKKQKIEAVIMNGPNDVKLFGFAAKVARVPKIIYRRGIAVPIKNSFLNRILYGKICTRIIANSEETKRRVLQNLNATIPPENVKVIYNSFNWTDYHVDEKVEGKNDKQAEMIVLGNAGRLCKQKGQKYLIELATALKNKNIRFKLLIAGEGELRDELNKSILENELQQHVELLGFVHDMKAFLQKIDIFLFPSLWEGFGFAIAEAMAMQKPVVAFNVSSNPELIVHEKTGFLVTTENSQEFEEATFELIQSSLLRANMGNEGLQHIKQKFSTDKSVQELLCLLRE